MSKITVSVSEECMHLLRSISQPDIFIRHVGVCRAGNCKQTSSSLCKKKHTTWNKSSLHRCMPQLRETAEMKS